jgi:hypothetical protein
MASNSIKEYRELHRAGRAVRKFYFSGSVGFGQNEFSGGSGFLKYNPTFFGFGRVRAIYFSGGSGSGKNFY